MNVILILADQLSARWLGCYGCDAAVTPHLDALAARGARFERCISPMPVCMPARASMMTGRTAPHHGLFYNGWELGLDLPCYPQLLQAAGCQTLGVGKFHLECHGRSAHNDVRKYGFDRAAVTEDIRAGDWLDWVAAERPEHLGAATATCWPVPCVREYGPDRRDLTVAIAAARQQHPWTEVAAMTWPSVVPAESCQTQWIGDTALDYLASRDQSRPFFLTASFVDPHDPYDPPAEYLDRIDPALVPRPRRSTDPALAAACERFGEVPFVRRFAALEDADWQVMRRYYLASLAFIDDQVGRLTAAVEAAGLSDETIIIFLADHGDMLGDHQLPTKGPWHFDACYRVPLIVAGPGVSPGVRSQTVSLLDLFPTVLEAAGVDHDVPIEGRSLWPLLQGEGGLDRPDAALVESFGAYGSLAPAVQATSVITPTANLTCFHDGGAMLFDLAADPDETTNLIDVPAAAGLRDHLTALMRDLLIARNCPPPNRNRHPWAQH